MLMADTLTKKELDEWIKFMKSAVLDLQLCTKNIRIIIEGIDKRLEWYRHNERFYGHYVYLSYSHSCLVVCKLFLCNEKRSFIKLFNKLANFKYSPDLTKALQSKDEEILEKIDAWRNLIDNKDHIIKKITDRRNTFYAHFDPEKKSPPEKLKEIKELSNLAETIFQDIYNTLFDKSHFFNTKDFEIRPWYINDQ